MILTVIKGRKLSQKKYFNFYKDLFRKSISICFNSAPLLVFALSIAFDLPPSCLLMSFISAFTAFTSLNAFTLAVRGSASLCCFCSTRATLALNLSSCSKSFVRGFEAYAFSCCWSYCSHSLKVSNPVNNFQQLQHQLLQ